MIGLLLHTRAVRRYTAELMSPCMHDGMSFEQIYRKKRAVKLLAQWNIRGPETLYQNLQWLLYRGYRAEFDAHCHDLSTFSAADKASLAPSLPDDDGRARKRAMVLRFEAQLAGSGIDAFDYAWCIVLANAGLTIGWINKDEAKASIIQAAVSAQEAYASWEEYLIGYQAGAAFSERFQDADFARQNVNFFERLQQAWQSPLHRVDWRYILRSSL